MAKTWTCVGWSNVAKHLGSTKICYAEIKVDLSALIQRLGIAMYNIYTTNTLLLSTAAAALMAQL